ncbi:MAG: dockerin type I domain-containing protein [Clostridium septicum]|uniref:dockerin type I domain-containing protein n=1 Tax=Clostridium septicum TaxID=1504 RepID=UPI002590F77C|nr:dockerin type I domain-containing protein [Clostridium septicum]MDU1314098.1 dockerin type I domain-containing protein [Clostridium septicum]
MENKKYKKILISLFMTFFIIIGNFSTYEIYAENFQYPKEEGYLGVDVYNSAEIDRQAYQRYSIPDEINNIVIFIRFKGEREFVNKDSISVINDIYNGDDISLKAYLSDLTYGRVKSSTTFYPLNSENNYYSYEAPHSREYYKKKSIKNLQGYENNSERFTRENELLVEATNSISSQVNIPKEKLDYNGDGAIDNVTYVISGLPEGHGDLLWPHKTTLSNTAYINGKRIGEYNILLQGTANTGVMGKYTRLVGVVAHEFLHTFYFPDLYRYNNSSANPVGKWDIMASTARNPQLPLVYTRRIYDGGEEIPEITSDGEYKISPSNSSNKEDIIAYKIKSSLSKDQYFVVEFRKGDDKWDKVLNINNPGLLVYRIDESVSAFNGNKLGHPDHIYVFRPKATSPEAANGDIDEALISPGLGETKIGKVSSGSAFDSDTLYFQNGSNSGIEIYDIKFTDDGNLDFKVKFPEIEGEGSKEKPFIIKTADQFNNIRNNSNVYYKLANNIDMSEIENFLPIEKFDGNLDGQGYTIKNIKINRPTEEAFGIFGYISNKAVVKNINFENVNIVGNRMIGGVAERNDGEIENIKISGRVLANRDYVGGLVNSNGGKIINSISTVDITGGDYIGGITANNYYGTIENSVFGGSLKITEGNKVAGIAARNYETVSIVKNSYWNVEKSKVEVGAVEGDGDLTKGMIGVKLEENVQANVGGKTTFNITLIGNPEDTKLINGEFRSNNKELINTINIVEKNNNRIEYSFVPDKPGNVKLTYGINIEGNTFNIDTNVNIKNNFLKEDINKDGVVDIEDLSLIAVKYNVKSIDNGWDSKYDLNGDGIIDILDLVKISHIIN